MNVNNTKLKFWLPAALWVCFIFIMSTAIFSAQNTSSVIEPILRFLFPSFSHREIEHYHYIIRKLAHLTEYFISGMLLYRAFRSGSSEHHAWRWVFYSLIVLVILASFDEYHQSFVAGRTSSMVDVGIDTVGGVAALAISTLKRWFQRKE